MYDYKKKIITFIAFLLLSLSFQGHAEKAPQFTLLGNNGKISLSDYKNKVVYVDFWASWCVPCRKSFPFMNNMQQRYAKKGLVIIAINLDTERSSADHFLKKSPAKFTIAYDPEGITPEKYKLSVMPTSYLIDKKGNIINVHKGFKNSQKDKMEKLIIRALSTR